MPRGDARSLVLWSWIVLALLAAHDVTHVLDDGLDTSPGQLAIVAIPQWLALAGLMAVVVRDDGGHGRTAALLLGTSVVVGFAIVHLLPITPISFWELQPSLVSWVLAWASTAAGLLLAVLARPPLKAVQRAHAG
jgi:hypothetical protein